MALAGALAALRPHCSRLCPGRGGPLGMVRVRLVGWGTFLNDQS